MKIPFGIVSYALKTQAVAALWVALCFGRPLPGQNLVVSPGFENAVPSLRQGPWTAVTGTPDYYNTNHPERNTNSGLERTAHAFEGEAYLGIACLGASRWQCRNSREYVCGRLSEPLAAGERYEVSLYVRLASEISTFPLAEMGIFFSPEEPGEEEVCSKALKYLPLRGESPLLAPAQRWQQVKGYYTAGGGESILTIGNFLGANLKRISAEANSASRSYYFLDQVSVVKAEPPRTLSLPGKQPEPSLPPACSCTVFFETGSSQIPEPAPQCLQQVLLATQGRPAWQLQIDGHTDDIGSEPANRQLSEARAGAVARFFTERSIPSAIISVRSFGPSRPASHSPTPEGRASNRRVEARLLPPPLQEWQFHALEAFAALYGYVRFFHPYAPAAELDWNRFAAYGVGRISELEKEEEYLPLLRELFYPVAPTLALGRQGGKAIAMVDAPQSSTTQTYWQHYGYRIGEGNDVYRSVRVSPAAGVAPLFEGAPSSEPWKGILPLGLHFELPLVLPDGYRAPDPGRLEILEQALAEALLPDRGRQLANVILFWNAVQHFYPYRGIFGGGMVGSKRS
ncbi:MAG: OmpA family protein, partial [Lewinellaceae bacterium]|nr:OmpA family protein [Lewinellaceae bacterium]